LLIIGGIAGMFGSALHIDCGKEIISLAVCDVIIGIGVWTVVRFVALKKQSAALLRSTKVFVWIMVYWGIFQLLCSLVYFTWQKSNFNALHLHLSSQHQLDQR